MLPPSLIILYLHCGLYEISNAGQNPHEYVANYLGFGSIKYLIRVDIIFLMSYNIFVMGYTYVRESRVQA